MINDSLMPSDFKSNEINDVDKQVISQTNSFRDSILLGLESTIPSNQSSLQLIQPWQTHNQNSTQYISARSVNSSYSIEAKGEIISNSYSAVLMPYNLITILGINPKLSGSYFITKVTHTINHNSYSQSFSVKRNAFSTSSAPSVPDVIF